MACNGHIKCQFPSFPPFLLKSALKQTKQNNCFQKTLSVLCKTHLTHRQSTICCLGFSLPVLWGVFWRNLFLSFSLLMVPFNFTCNWIFPLVILNFLARDGPIISWQIDGKTLETMTDFIFLGSEITADGYCHHKIKKHLFLGRKAMTNLDSILKSRDITLQTKVHRV